MAWDRQKHITVLASTREADGLTPIPRLQFVPPPTIERNSGARGEYREIPLSQLYIDHDYQRQILQDGKANIRRMAERFEWAKFGCLVVGARGPNRFAVIDGQHRACAALYRGDIDRVPCLILQGGQKQEAAAFAAVNANVTRIHPLQSFHAAVTAGDPDSVEVVAICAEADVKILAYPKTDMAPGETQSLVSIRNALRRHGKLVVVAALKLLRAMDPDGGLPATAVTAAIAMLALRHPEWCPKAEELGARIARPLASTAALALQRKATYGGTVAINFEQLLTAAIENMTRLKPRFASAEMERRATAGR